MGKNGLGSDKSAGVTSRGTRKSPGPSKNKTKAGIKKSTSTRTTTKGKQKNGRINAKAVKEQIARLNADTANVAEVAQLANSAKGGSKKTVSVLDAQTIALDLHKDKQNNAQRKQTNEDLVSQLEQIAGMEL